MSADHPWPTLQEHGAAAVDGGVVVPPLAFSADVGDEYQSSEEEKEWVPPLSPPC